MNDEALVIIGAGPAGLAAAYECVKKGGQPVVLERSDKVGGIARTETYKGYRFDVGGHRFFSKINRINRLWQEMLGQDMVRVPRLSRIYYQGKFFNYPLSCCNALANLGLVESLLIILSYCRAQLVPNPVEQNFEQWVENRFGRRLYRTFFKTYTEKVWGIPCREIQADWAAQRIKGLSLMAAVANAIFGTRQAKSLINEFDYPRLGPGMMWERFRRAIEARRGLVQLDSELLSLRHERGRVLAAVCRQGEQTTEVVAPHFISSIPITRLVTLFEPQAPAAVLAAARSLSHRDFMIVVLIIDQAELFPDQWIYVHSSDVRVGRIQNFKNWSAAMVPDSGKTSIGMEYFCNEGDALWSMSDPELLEMAGRELARLGLAGADIEDGLVIRQPGAYPIYDRDYGEKLAVLREFLAGFRNLQTVGRNGLHRYNNMDHSMQSGIMAVENIRGGGHNLWTINEEDAYLEELQTDEALPVPEKVLIRTFARLDKLAFAAAIGTVAGLLVFGATLWIISRGGNVEGSHLRLLAQYFIGYTVTVHGAFIAFGYTFFWGFIFGWLFAYLRNFFLALYLFHIKKKTELLSASDFFDQL